MAGDTQRYDKTFPISWEQLHRDSKALAWRLVDIKDWQGIVAITRGGLVPASIIARELDIRVVDTVCVSSYDFKKRGASKVLKSVEIDSTDWLLYLTALTAHEPEHFVYLADSTPNLAWQFFLYDEQGRWIAYGPLWYDAILAAIGSVSYAGAAFVFCRRDLPAPL